MNTGGSQFNEWSAMESVDLVWLLCSQELVSALISQSNRCVSPAALCDKLRCVATVHFSCSLHAITQENTQFSVEYPHGQRVRMVYELMDAELPQCV